MKTLAQIVAENRVTQHEQQAIEHKRTFETGLFTGLKVAFAEMLGSALKLVKKSTYSVKVENQLKLPDVQKVEGVVSLKELKTLMLGLNEVVKQLKNLSDTGSKNTTLLSKELKPSKVDFSNLEKAIKDIDIPETVIPEYPTVMQVSNLDELKKPLLELASKLKIEAPIVNVPPSPKTITVGNLEGIQSILNNINSKLDGNDEEPIGYSWTKSNTGKLVSFTELYSDGKIISTGWNLGIVKVDDQRDS